MDPLPFLTHGYRTYQIVLQSRMQDIKPLLVGYSQCTPGDTSFYPAHDYTLIHYIHAGKGVYTCNGHKESLSAGQAFITAPHSICSNDADSEDPWLISWVGFSGSLSPYFWDLPPFFRPGEPLFPHLVNLQQPSPNLDCELAADILDLYLKLVQPKNLKLSNANRYVQAVFDYIYVNYMNNPTIQEIAEHVGICRSWLSDVFKAQTGISVQHYLQHRRNLVAQELISQNYPMAEVAAMCGYHSLANFSRQFKRYKGVSPAQWKKGLKNRVGERRT